jgi:hypothetical protein
LPQAADKHFMDITGIGRTSRAHAPAATEPATDTREVVQAVRALNGAELLGKENLLVYEMDPKARRIVVRLVNRRTGDMVTEVPIQHLLRLAAGR